MAALLYEQFVRSIDPEIELHPAWIGNVSALKIEKLLKEYSIPYLYALRNGRE